VRDSSAAVGRLFIRAAIQRRNWPVRVKHRRLSLHVFRSVKNFSPSLSVRAGLCGARGLCIERNGSITSLYCANFSICQHRSRDALCCGVRDVVAGRRTSRPRVVPETDPVIGRRSTGPVSDGAASTDTLIIDRSTASWHPSHARRRPITHPRIRVSSVGLRLQIR